VIALHVLLVERDHRINFLVFKLCLIVKLLMLHQLLLLLGSVLQIRLLVPRKCELCSKAGHFFLQCIVLINLSLLYPAFVMRLIHLSDQLVILASFLLKQRI
jgi:hypothetical protein